MESETLIGSRTFKMTGGDFMRLIMSRYAFQIFFTTALLLIPAAIMGICLDLRWLIIFFMMLLLVIPMLMAYFYFWHGMKVVTVMNTLPHRLSFLQDELEFRFMNEDNEPTRSFKICYTDFSPYYIGGGCIIVPLKSKVRGFVWIPTKAFDEMNEFENAVGLIAAGIRKHEE